MPESDDVDAILARMRRELTEDEFRDLAAAVGVDPDAVDAEGGPGSTLPADAEEAKDGELKAAGKADDDRAAPDDAVTEAELEERLADIRADALTRDDLEEMVAELESSTREALTEELPGVAEQVGEKMATNGSRYGGSIASTFSPGGSPGPGRNPVAASRAGATSEKSNGSGDAVDYAHAIADAFETDD